MGGSDIIISKIRMVGFKDEIESQCVSSCRGQLKALELSRKGELSFTSAKRVERQSQTLKGSSWIMNKQMLSRGGTDKFLDYNFILLSKL